jgi:uncharacterized protein DUF4395
VFSRELRRRSALFAVALTLLLAVPRPAGAETGDLGGTFALTGGTCPSGAGVGSYFRMVQPSGNVNTGPFVANGDSTCSDQTYTLLSPGSDGGFVTGAYQPAPDPAFDASGNSLATRIVVPAKFFGVSFGLSTDPTDRQSGRSVPPLVVRADSGGALTGDLRAWAATWNKQNFNQGAPKPDGSTPGLTTAPHGAYNASTGAFVLEWASTVVGGPFNDFTGVWHLTGTFRGAGTPAAAASSPTKTPTRQAPTAVADATVTTAPTQVAGVATDNTLPPAASGTQIVGAVKQKGWLPPAWLIVLTSVVGVGAALALLVPNRAESVRVTDDPPPTTRRKSRKAAGVALAIGIGLALAPVGFQMFTRAPKGGDMIQSFKPYMRTQKIDSFRGFMRDIDKANTEVAPYAAQYPGVAALDKQWPSINADMTDMLTTMRADIPRYDGVAALPPFVLFPWFFVLPGVMIAGVALWLLLGGVERGRLIGLVALGIGLIAAPGVFQMFSRAPGGAQMINDFKPLMTTAKVTRVQRYFLTIGLAEGDLRNKLVPAEAAHGHALPAASALSAEWPEQSGQMAPMIAAMSDNLGNFAAVVAMPPFWMFPWFFVLPGILVLGAALFLWRSAQEDGSVPKIIGFPNPVNEVSARFVAVGVVLMSVTAIVFDVKWILPILFYGFVARVLTGPKLSPLGQLVTKQITPRLPFKEKPVAGPPKRFAQGMGVAFSGVALLLALTDHWFAGQVVLGLLVVAASLEGFVGYCLGCKVFGILMRFGWIPEEICEECNNVGQRIIDLRRAEAAEAAAAK